jgi:hypothetical protein
MANTVPAVMEFVERELKANPDVKTSELFERARSVDSSVASLSARQFNALYPLQIKRRQKLESGEGRAGGRRMGGRRSRRSQEEQFQAVRKVMVRFASDLSGAEEMKDLVDIMANLDKYVSDVLKAAGR